MNLRIIAKRYADALYSEYKKNKEAAKVWEEFNALASLQKESEDFDNVVKNPLITDEEKRSVFKALKDAGKINTLLYNFISLLIDKKRLMFLSSINDEVKRLILIDNGEIEAHVVFAAMAESSSKTELEKKLESVTGKKIIVKDTIDPQLIGGVKVRMGSILYDASIKGQLDKMKASLL